VAIYAKLKKLEQEPIKLGFKNNRLHMQVFVEFWKGFRLLPSAWLLLLQFIMLILALLSGHSLSLRVLVWGLGVLVLLLIAKVIRQTPVFTILGLSFVLFKLNIHKNTNYDFSRIHLQRGLADN
jgi:hypothetical protein